MKKIVVTLIVCICGFAFMNAQEKPSFGFKAGLNFIEFDNNNAKDNKSTGFHAGIVLHIPLPKKLGVQGEAYYSLEKIKDLGDLSYVNVPILLTYKILPGFRFQLGPQFKIKASTDFEESQKSIENDTKSVNFDGALGLEFRLPVVGIFAQARYNYGFTDTIDKIDGSLNSFQLSVGYRF